MSQDTATLRLIEIAVLQDGPSVAFQVKEGDRYSGLLTLGELVEQLLDMRDGKDRYGMRTRDEHVKLREQQGYGTVNTWPFAEGGAR